MKITSKLITDLHLNQNYCLLTARNVTVVYEYFKLLDVHNAGSLNDLQFFCFMKSSTNLNRQKIREVQKILDRSGAGLIDFSSFCALICLLIAIKDRVAKRFIFQNSKFVFKLLDEDNQGTLSAREMKKNG